MNNNNSFTDANKQIKSAAVECGWFDMYGAATGVCNNQHNVPSIGYVTADRVTVCDPSTQTIFQNSIGDWQIGPTVPRDTAKTRYFNFVARTFKEMETLIQNKSHDYSVGDDPFVNFKTSEDLGVDKLVGLNVRLLDKVARIKSFSKSGSLKNEGIKDAYKDLIGYAVLALGMLEEDEHK